MRVHMQHDLHNTAGASLYITSCKNMTQCKEKKELRPCFYLYRVYFLFVAHRFLLLTVPSCFFREVALRSYIPDQGVDQQCMIMCACQVVFLIADKFFTTDLLLFLKVLEKNIKFQKQNKQIRTQQSVLVRQHDLLARENKACLEQVKNQISSQTSLSASRKPIYLIKKIARNNTSF